MANSIKLSQLLDTDEEICEFLPFLMKNFFLGAQWVEHATLDLGVVRAPHWVQRLFKKIKSLGNLVCTVSRASKF